MGVSDAEVRELLNQVVSAVSAGGEIQVREFSLLANGKPYPPTHKNVHGDMEQDKELMNALTVAIQAEAALPNGRIVFKSHAGAGVTNYVARNISANPS